MKNHPLMSRSLRRVFAAACLLVVMVSGQAFAQTGATDVDAKFRQGRTAYEQGNLDQAELQFREILTLMPNHVPSRSYMQKINDRREKAQRVDLKTQLSKIKVEKVSMKDASLSDAVGYLRKKMPELIAKSETPDLNVNFVVFARGEQANAVTIPELELANIPVTQLIDYIGRMTGFVAVYQNGIVEFRPAAK